MNRRRTFTNAGILAAFTIFCVVVLEFLAINIGQPNPLSSGYNVHAVFADADGIPTAADVRVSGVVVGKVTDVSHDRSSPGYTLVTLSLNRSSAVPLYTNGFATVRPKTLLGEKYIDLTVGSPTTAESIPSGGFLAVAQTRKDVSNDEIFNSFDASTRAEQQQVLAALNSATLDRAGDIQALLPQLEQVIANLSPVAQVYEKDQQQTDDIFVQLNAVMQTLAKEHEQLAGFLANGNVALGAVAQKDSALVTTLQEASNVAAEINQAMTPTIAAQRQSLAELEPTLNSENVLLYDIVGPKCHGQPCGIDTVIGGTLNGQIAYPNDQLNVETPNGERVTSLWDSMFSEPGASNNTVGQAPDKSSACHTQPSVAGGGTCALNIVLSFHCDTVASTVAGQLGGLISLLPPSEQPLIQQEILSACQTVTGHATTTATTPAADPSAMLAGLF